MQWVEIATLATLVAMQLLLTRAVPSELSFIRNFNSFARGHREDALKERLGDCPIVLQILERIGSTPAAGCDSRFNSGNTGIPHSSVVCLTVNQHAFAQVVERALGVNRECHRYAQLM